MKKILFASILTSLAACGGGSGSEAVTLAPGFTAPNMLEGRAGGLTDASSLGDGCIGRIGSDPDHTVTLSAAIPNLRVFAQAGEDITLVIQQPDGSYICDDDTEGLNPLVTQENWAAGDYKIWVGSYNTEDGGAAYKLGFSEDGTAMPSMLGSN